MSSDLGRLLGRTSDYPTRYCPEILEPIPRALGRAALLGDQDWPYHGEDVWTAYEVAYLDPDGRPHVAIAHLHIPCHSPNIVESKSLKLYLFSLNNEVFTGPEAVAQRVQDDISAAVGAQVRWIFTAQHDPINAVQPPVGRCIDDAPLVRRSLPEAQRALVAHGPDVVECLHSELLRSLCPVTAQPDWGTITVAYEGPKIDAGALLSYIVAFRDHQGFHEQCVEQIFVAVLQACGCKHLTVYARYTRRGGLDINPVRTTEATWPAMARDRRQ